MDATQELKQMVQESCDKQLIPETLLIQFKKHRANLQNKIESLDKAIEMMEKVPELSAALEVIARVRY